MPSNDDKTPDPKTIELRPYQVYLERGSDPGHDFEDWLEAEREHHFRTAMCLRDSGRTADVGDRVLA